MDIYIATVEHHSLAQHYSIEISGTLGQAKQAATKEFGDGFADNQICIYKKPGHDLQPLGNPVARRRIGDKKWQ